MRRRAVLASVAGLASSAGCFRLVADEIVRVRAKRPPEGVAADAERHCALGASFVADHPTLERVTAAAADAPREEWVTEEVEPEDGRALAAALHEHCSAVGGVYHYDGATFVLEVNGDDGGSLFPGNTTGSEAIRGVHSESRP
jgi:hypothetical protein